MGDLHSTTYSSNLHCSPLGWDLHSHGVFDTDMSHFTNSTTPPFFFPNDGLGLDHSTGYLQDALFEVSDRIKRRRLQFDRQFNITSDSIEQESCWDLYQEENYPENISFLSQMTGSNEVLDVKIGEEEEEMSVSEVFDYSSSSPIDPKDFSDAANSTPNKELDADEVCDGKGKRAMTRIVYPFALVKPGGIEGDLTLNDINRRILMPPTRPVKHPVGDYACRPVVASPHGPGLSGKAVVALTRLHTRGRKGTITIIRTKG